MIVLAETGVRGEERERQTDRDRDRQTDRDRESDRETKTKTKRQRHETERKRGSDSDSVTLETSLTNKYFLGPQTTQKYKRKAAGTTAPLVLSTKIWLFTSTEGNL